MAISFSPDAAEGTMRDAALTAVMLGAAGTRPAWSPVSAWPLHAGGRPVGGRQGNRGWAV